MGCQPQTWAGEEGGGSRGVQGGGGVTPPAPPVHGRSKIHPWVPPPLSPGDASLEGLSTGPRTSGLVGADETGEVGLPV